MSGSRATKREALLGYGLLLPALTVFGVFTFYPFLRNFYLGFYRNPPFPNLPRTYAGLRQYRDVLTSHSFTSSLWDTVYFALLTVPVGVVLALLLAVAAHQRLRGIGIYRTIFSSTVASSVAVAAVIFGTLMNPVVGLLPWLGVNPHPPFLQNPTLALPAIAVLTVWQNLGLGFIVLSAGLQAVPDELQEAAAVDGAGPVRRFWSVTVPLLSPTLFFVAVVGTIVAFQSFGQIDLLTGGAYGNSVTLHTDVLTYNVYRTLVYGSDPGRAAILSIALFLVTLVLTVTQMRVLERRVSYAS
ncbi:MAG TPA: sugar ABC transporter permease [Acidimicrobiales bacterium]|nr:sugar ABC transporter permease [Acidimicrobiales bacterium]